ncbi:MAG: hypothetical protein ABR552_05630 [Actinomycetota bacterium]
MVDGAAGLARASYLGRRSPHAHDTRILRADLRVALEGIAMLGTLALLMWAFSFAVKPGILIPSHASDKPPATAPSDKALDDLFGEPAAPQHAATVARHTAPATAIKTHTTAPATQMAPQDATSVPVIPPPPPVQAGQTQTPEGTSITVAGIKMTLPL